jgi:hypothetical protein
MEHCRQFPSFPLFQLPNIKETTHQSVTRRANKNKTDSALSRNHRYCETCMYPLRSDYAETKMQNGDGFRIDYSFTATDLAVIFLSERVSSRMF